MVAGPDVELTMILRQSAVFPKAVQVGVPEVFARVPSVQISCVSVGLKALPLPEKAPGLLARAYLKCVASGTAVIVKVPR